MAAYVHNGFGLIHRVRHRFADEETTSIDPLPMPPGKTEGTVGNLCVDPQNVVHFVYDATRPALMQRSDPLYPDASLVYVPWHDGQWGTPQVVRAHLGADAAATNYYVLSASIGLDAERQLTIIYASSRWGPAQPISVYCVRQQAQGWSEQLVGTVSDPSSTSPRLDVSPPAFDQRGRTHFAVCDGKTTSVFSEREGPWQQTPFPGELQGFAAKAGSGSHLLVSQGRTLEYHWLSDAAK